MLEVLLTVVPAFLWLFMRCYQLFQTPLEKLFKKLNIEIPYIPQVTVDSLGESHVVLHWDVESAAEEHMYYVVLLNGRETATLAGKAIKLCGLHPNHMYLVRVIAVNAQTNFRSQSLEILVTTTDSKAFAELELRKNDPEWSVRSWTSDLDETTEKSLLSMGCPPQNLSEITDEQLLRDYGKAVRLELHKTHLDIAAANAVQKTEMLLLVRSFEEYKDLLSEEQEHRGKKDLDVKELEKRKDLLTFEKLKLSKQLKNHHSHKNIHMSNLAELRSRIAKLEEKKHHALNTAKLEKSRVDATVEQLHKDISALKDQVAELENHSKQLNTERKDLAHQITVLKPLVEQFTVFNQQPTGESSPNASQTSLSSVVFEVFTRDSVLTKGGAELLKKLLSLRPDWEADINREAEALNALELSWKTAYRNAIRKFVLTYNNAEIARAAATPGYQPQKTTEYQASVDFGGFSNALPKSRTPKVYTFVDEGSASSTPDSPALDTTLQLSEAPPSYGRAMDGYDTNMGHSNLEMLPMNMESQASNALPDYSLGDYPMAQSNSIQVPMMSNSNSLSYGQQPYNQQFSYNNGYQTNVSLSNLAQNGIPQHLRQNVSVPLDNTTSGQLLHPSLLGMPMQTQDSVSSYSHPDALLNFLFPLQHTLLTGMQQDQLQPSLPLNNLQMLFLPGISYEDQMFRSPTPDSPPYGTAMQQPLPSLWNTQATNSVQNGPSGGLGTSRPFQNQMPLSPRPVNVELSPSQSVNESILDSLLLSSNSQLLQNGLGGNLSLSIWLDRLTGHNRALSGGNHIWRNDIQSGMLSSDFQPFRKSKEREETEDIQLL